MPHNSGGWKSENKVLAGMVPSEVCARGSVPRLSPTFCDLLAVFGALWLVEAGQLLPVRAEGHAVHGFLVLGEHVDAHTLLHVPKSHGSIE